MVEQYARRLAASLPEDRREAVIRRARAVLNFGYRLYALPLRLGSLPLLQLSRSASVIGTAIPRFYWAHFLEQHRSAFRGYGVEVGVTKTIRRMGGAALTQIDAINITPEEGVTVVADLCQAWDVASDTFDVFLNQFTLHMVRDEYATLYHSIRILKPGGRLVVNFPCLSGFSEHGANYGGHVAFEERWFSPKVVERLLNQMVSPSDYTLRTYGNRQAKASYILGIGAEALPESLLLRHDSGWPVLVCAVVTKPENWQPDYRPPDAPGVG